MTDRLIRILITLISILLAGCFIVNKSYAGLQFALPSKFTTKNTLVYPKKAEAPEDPVIVIPDVGRAMVLNKPRATKTQTQYFISAKSGHYENGIITLSNAPLVGHFPLEMNGRTSALLPMQFVDRWQTLVLGNENKAPESILSIYTRQGTNNIALNLNNPRVNDRSISFTVNGITGELPADFKLSTLFIRTDVETQPTVSAFDITPVEPVTEKMEMVEGVAKTEEMVEPEITKPETITDKYDHVYVLTSKNGRFVNGKLTLENIPTALLYQKGNNSHEALDIFTAQSGIGMNGAVTGSLILYTQTSANRILISFSNMKHVNNGLTFDAEILKGELPENFRLSTVFFTLP